MIPAHGVDRRIERRARQLDVGHHVDDDENVDRYRQPEEVPLPEVAVPPAEARDRKGIRDYEGDAVVDGHPGKGGHEGVDARESDEGAARAFIVTAPGTPPSGSRSSVRAILLAAGGRSNP